jgi:mRNA-degrading endonuclease toxin of MazEF toxin-antitoxin module
VPFIQDSISQIALLSQIKIVDYRRLKNKIGELDDTDFQNIHTQFLLLFGKK